MKEENIITDKIVKSLNKRENKLDKMEIDVGTQKKIFVGTTCGSYREETLGCCSSLPNKIW